MKDLCQKWKVKLIIQVAFRLSGTGIVQCLEIIDVGCNLKQFDGLTWLTLTPVFYDSSTLLHRCGRFVLFVALMCIDDNDDDDDDVTCYRN